MSNTKDSAIAMNHIGIDVSTRSVNYLLRRLNKLKAVQTAVNGGVYHQDESYSQIHMITSMTEDQVCDWLYFTNLEDHEYLGTFCMEVES